MKLGIAYPQTELGGAPEAVAQFACGLERAGFDHMAAYDHVVGAVHKNREPPLTGPYTEKDPFHDPFMLFAHVAAITTRLEMVTGILILPQRPTVLVAKQALDLSLFSNDRFRMGVGTGWNWVEYEALGANFRHRGARLDEQIELLRKLWTGEVISHQGPVETIDRATLVLKPRKPIQIWMGGFQDPAFRRAARVGDGFLFASPNHWERMRFFLEQEGRPTEEFGRELFVSVPHYSAREVADVLAKWRDAGHTHACVETMRRGMTTVEQHLEFASEVKRLMD
jgi:probable F420-dependent oxidoreductase